MSIKDEIGKAFGDLVEALTKLNDSVSDAHGNISDLTAALTEATNNFQSVEKRLTVVEDEVKKVKDEVGVGDSVVDTDILGSIRSATSSVLNAINEAERLRKPEAIQHEDSIVEPAGAVANAGAGTPKPVDALTPPVPAGTLPPDTRVIEATPGVVPVHIPANARVTTAGSLSQSVTVTPII